MLNSSPLRKPDPVPMSATLNACFNASGYWLSRDATSTSANDGHTAAIIAMVAATPMPQPMSPPRMPCSVRV